MVLTSCLPWPYKPRLHFDQLGFRRATSTHIYASRHAAQSADVVVCRMRIRHRQPQGAQRLNGAFLHSPVERPEAEWTPKNPPPPEHGIHATERGCGTTKKNIVAKTLTR